MLTIEIDKQGRLKKESNIQRDNITRNNQPECIKPSVTKRISRIVEKPQVKNSLAKLAREE